MSLDENSENSAWKTIDSAPWGKMFIAIGKTDGNEYTGGRPYVTDPWIVWKDSHDGFARWSHEWAPTHWAEIPEFEG